MKNSIYYVMVKRVINAICGSKAMLEAEVEYRVPQEVTFNSRQKRPGMFYRYVLNKIDPLEKSLGPNEDKKKAIKIVNLVKGWLRVNRPNTKSWIVLDFFDGRLNFYSRMIVMENISDEDFAFSGDLIDREGEKLLLIINVFGDKVEARETTQTDLGV